VKVKTFRLLGTARSFTADTANLVCQPRRRPGRCRDGRKKQLHNLRLAIRALGLRGMALRPHRGDILRPVWARSRLAQSRASAAIALTQLCSCFFTTALQRPGRRRGWHTRYRVFGREMIAQVPQKAEDVFTFTFSRNAGGACSTTVAANEDQKVARAQARRARDPTDMRRRFCHPGIPRNELNAAAPLQCLFLSATL